MPRNDEAECTQSESAGKENERQENEPECSESKNEQQERVHDRNALGDQDGDSECICRAHGTHGPGVHARGTESTSLKPNA
jgi:hypothetical protein